MTESTNEIKDSLQLIQEGLKEPIAPIKPAEFDDEAIFHVMTARNKRIVYPPFFTTRNKKLNEKDKVVKEEDEA